MVVTIRPYQSEGLEFLVSHGRAALWDEPGLGKTMQTLLSMRDLEPRGTILVVCTGDAIGVWIDEIRFWLDEEPTVFAGLGASTDALDNPHGFVITNYHRLATALTYRWDGVIFDESQALRNRNTATLFKTVRSHFDKKRTGLQTVPAFFLSGTPIVKHTGDMWPILHLLDKQKWSSYWRFVNKYAVTWHDDFGWHVEGVTNALNLWREVSSVALRRTVAEVQPNLPPIIRQRVPLEMTRKQAKAYRELEKDLYTEVAAGSDYLLTPSALSLETRLRQLLVSPRLLGIDDDGAGILALVDIARSHSRPFVVFMPFVEEAMPAVEAALLRTGRPIYRVRGGMGLKLHESVNLFKQAAKVGEAPILLAGLAMAKSWSVSTVTYECYMLEYDWNDTTMVQAERRLGRDGQTETVFSRYFVHQDSHDFEALDILSGKRRLAKVILDRARLRVR